MTLYFAYGSNMSRASMAARCPGARPLGVATLAGWRFIIGADGYASIVPAPGGEVIGVLWRIGLRDVAALNAYEGIDRGLYRRSNVTLRHQGRIRSAMAYIGRAGGEARPRPGYVQQVVTAARDWDLPERYIHGLQRWSAAGLGNRAVETGQAGGRPCAMS